MTAPQVEETPQQDNGMDCEHRTGGLLIADLQVNTLGRNIYTKYIRYTQIIGKC